MSKRKTFTVPIYDCKVVMWKDKAACEEAVGSEIPDCEGAAWRWRAPLDVYIDPDSRNSVTALVHESLHLAFFLLGRRGVEVDAENHEALTYLQGYILDKMLDYYIEVDDETK